MNNFNQNQEAFSHSREGTVTPFLPFLATKNRNSVSKNSSLNPITMEKMYNSTGVSSPTRTERTQSPSKCVEVRTERTLSLSKGSSTSFFKSFAFTLAMLVVGISGVWGQTQHTVVPTGGTAGNTNGTGSDPICRYFNSIRYQVVYTVAELNAAGLTGSSQITRLAWNVTESSVSLANYTVQMANVTAANSATHNATATTTVKNAFTYGVALGYNDIVFDVPFTWNGTSNLLIEICSGTTNPYTSPYGGVQAKTGITSGSRSYRVDLAAACATNTSLANTTKPYVRLTKASTIACSGTPSAGTATITSATGCPSTNFTLNSSGLTAGIGITYQWQTCPTVGGTYTDVGAAGSSLTTSTATTAYYKLKTTCSGSGLVNYSNVVSYTVVTCCTNTLQCYDSYGDGWNGGTVNLYVGGSLVGNYTIASGFGPTTVNFSAYSGQAIQVTMAAAGSYPTEMYFNVLNGGGTPIVSNWYPNTSGTWNGTASCPLPPTITSISPASGCPGASLTITGTNLTGATAANVKVGGTSVSSITSNTGTSMVVVIGTGTTGTVAVTTISTATSSQTFTVNSAPAAPTANAATATTTTTSTANWSASAGATQYFLDVSTSNVFASFVGSYNNLNVGNVTTQTITGLTANTTYYYRVRASNGSCSSLSSGTISFFTGYCVPTTVTGCSMGDLIASVQLNTLSNVTGSTCTAEYNNYTGNPALTTTLLPSSSYNCVIGTSTYGQDFAVWIDYNDDLVFDVSERVGYTTATVPANSTATFNITLACTPPSGTHRMRVRSAYATAGVSITPCGTQSYGEIEDYLVTIAAAPACPNPGVMTTVTPSFTSVALSWSAGCATGTSYDFQYGPQGFTIGSGTTVTNQTVSLSGGVASFTLSGLTSNTQYSLYYRANCGASTSSWSLVSNFATLCTPTGDETTFGNGSWIGYVYNSASAGAFTTYKGTVTEAETFNTSHATTPVGATTNLCLGTNSDLFSIRYKMTKNFPAGDYIFTIGGDDGVRLSVDGGTTWLINNWIDQGYTQSSNAVPVSLNGSTNLVFEFYENVGGAQSSFAYALAPVPTCATYSSPANGSTGQLVAPVLTWGSVANATSYDVYIGAGSLPSTPTATVTGTTYTAICSGLTSYVWMVVPKNAQGAATGCATWSFTTMNIDYATAWISANTGNAWWCAGETRSVTVTLKNNGAVAWIDGGGADFNVGIKWNAEPDYIVRVDAQNLAAGATGTFTFNVTAPTAGVNSLTFDVVKEGAFWFGTNSNGAGPGNSTNASTANVNSTYPTVNAGVDVTSCIGNAVNLTGTSPNVNPSYTGSNSASTAISDLTTVASAITVAGTNANANQISSVTLNITHTWDSDMSISLVAPNGSVIDLSSGNGGSGDNYTNTVFSTSGTAITAGTVPFTGTYTPEQAFSNLTGSADGVWKLQIYDAASGDVGTLTNWSLNFNLPAVAPTVSWTGPNSFTASTLATSVSAAGSGAANYSLSSTYRGCTTTDVVQVTGTGPTTLATTPTAGSAVWRGASSTDWTTASNWYAYDGTNYTVATATPTASSSVIIPANQGCVTQQPAVAISGTVNADNLTVETGAALTMGTSSVLNVAGNFTINGTGTFTPGTGTVNFIGGNGVTQLVTVGSQAFNNVTLNGFGTVQMTGNTTINGNFLNSDGTLDMNNFNLTVGGNYANYNSSSGLLPGTGTVIFNKASGTQTVDQLALDFNHIQHTGAGTLQLISDLSTTGDIINSAGTFDANDKIITVRNNFTNTATFTPGTGGLGEIYFEKIGGTQTLTSGGAVFQKFAHTGTGTLNLAGIVEVKGDVVIDAPISAGTSTLKLSGTGNQIMSGTEAVIALKDMTVAKTNGTVTLSKPVRVDGALTMTQGNIITSATNKLEIGSSTSALGSVNWTSGNVVGPMRRWFAGATNSTAASGMFPVGLSNVNRYAQVNFTQAPGSGGYIDMEYKAGVPITQTPWTYLTTPDGQVIQTFENEGYWDITPYNASGNAYPSGLNTNEFTLKLRANGLTSVNDISVTRIIRSPGPDHTTWEPAGFHLASSGQITDFAIESNTVIGFSWFNIGAPNNSPLPVELLSFNGTCNEGMVNLAWQTASEFNSSHFDVEKSTDGETWRVMATIPSAGTSNELLTYQAMDNSGTNGSNYYRLRQVDNDGKEKLYDPINVSCVETTAGYFTSYPNPSGNEFQVVVNNKEILGACTLNIVDAQGKVIDQRSIEVKEGINMFVISETLNPGIYFLNITNGTKTTQVIKHAVK